MRIYAVTATAMLGTASSLAVWAESGTSADGEIALRRWISAPGVNLRSRPALDAPVLQRMTKNTQVRLEGTEDEAFCAVSVTNNDGARISGFTACRYLAKTARPDDTLPSALFSSESRADDERLARGTFGQAPLPSRSWAELKASAMSLRPGTQGESSQPAEVATVNTLMETLSLWSIEREPERPGVAVDLVRAIELPAVAPSMFRSPSEIGPPFEDAVG